jgi:prolyl-tRNA synthetase
LEGFRVKVDDREEVTPGFKFNDWEMRGVPLRIEIGPKDVEQGQVTLSRRDEKGRSSAPVEGVAAVVQATLDEIQDNMLAKARAFMQENTHDPADYAEFQEVVKTGWADVWWCGRADCEAEIKQDTKATNRVIPIDQPGGEGVCIHCGNPAAERAIFARAY